MIQPPMKFPDRCSDCGCPVSDTMIYMNEVVKEGRKKYYIMVGPLCAECSDKRKKLDIPPKR